MAAYILRRLLLMVPTLVGITALVFFIMWAAPGDVAEMLISAEGEMTPGDRAARVAYIQERYGLDDPPVVQYVRWLNKVSPVGVFNDGDERSRGFGVPIGSNDEGQTRRLGVKTPDFGHSFISNRPVLDVIGDALPITLLLNILSIPIIYSIAIITGIYSARHRGGLIDVSTGVSTLALWAMPQIWVGVLLIGFLANVQYLHWFPTGGLHSEGASRMPFLPRTTEAGFEPGYLLDAIHHLILPVICMTYAGFAFLSKLCRSSVLENLRADFVRTARAKGVADNAVLWQHVFRNSLLPLITVAAYIVPGLMAGSIVVERIFSIRGMGYLVIQAIEFKDQEVVMAVTLFSGLLTVTAYLVADLLYAAADPRVSYE